MAHRREIGYRVDPFVIQVKGATVGHGQNQASR